MTTTRAQATATVQVDNDRVTVTEWRFEPAAETGWHRHARDYVVVPMKSGTLRLEMPDGSSAMSELTAGHSYFRRAGVEHNVVNASGEAFSFVEIELQEAVEGPSGGPSHVPTASRA